MKKIAIFVSGNGTNCENLIRHFQSSELARVELVVSNRADAFALTRAENLGVETAVIAKAEFAEAHNVVPLLRSHGIDYVVLAGFLLMVPDYLISEYDGKILNLHPSLLPKYGGRGMYGHHVHEAVKAAGETETGITIHRVSNVCDGGEIVAQFNVPLTNADTVEDIEAKIHRLEMKHFPEVVEKEIGMV
ncbi:MAG: phosphoribosylglycinamide formyltransferase [Prevotella sp.]|uniref:phosphoribosylglycinamide formyltransferase n=1 Tax=Prevotella sp. TaxID=59823 RepID=UPI002A30468D|nr:phosphoribosylglycinamide formyltransferase [Prevotella sp.]MDD7317488.1 phosphoribosylglycinamide formyltransferase [Prevotellaceae bacterium]MDY4019176.1 phosphoribosylglycinamide formyltransferase [Prevotella sp.]